MGLRTRCPLPNRGRHRLRTSVTTTDDLTQRDRLHHDQLILELRDELIDQSLDAGADTIRWHFETHHRLHVSRPTIHRILIRNDRITPDPKKRPRSSYVRFEAELPNECWQSDFTHYPVADGTDVEVLSWGVCCRFG